MFEVPFTRFHGNVETGKLYLGRAKKALYMMADFANGIGANVYGRTVTLDKDKQVYAQVKKFDSFYTIDIYAEIPVPEELELEIPKIANYYSGLCYRSERIEEENEEDVFALHTFNPTEECAEAFEELESGTYQKVIDFDVQLNNGIYPGLPYWGTRDFGSEDNTTMDYLRNDTLNTIIEPEKWCQTNSIRGCNYTGGMAELVSLLLGYGRLNDLQGTQIEYDCSFNKTHGVLESTTGKYWIIEISERHGIIAKPMTFFNVVAGNQYAQYPIQRWGGYPDGSSFPADLSGETNVIELMSPEDYASIFFDGADFYAPWLGWAFNPAGTEARLTCTRLKDAPALARGDQWIYNEYWKLNLSINDSDPDNISTSATITELESKVCLYPVMHRGPESDWYDIPVFLYNSRINKNMDIGFIAQPNQAPINPYISLAWQGNARGFPDSHRFYTEAEANTIMSFFNGEDIDICIWVAWVDGMWEEARFIMPVNPYGEMDYPYSSAVPDLSNFSSTATVPNNIDIGRNTSWDPIIRDGTVRGYQSVGPNGENVGVKQTYWAGEKTWYRCPEWYTTRKPAMDIDYTKAPDSLEYTDFLKSYDLYPVTTTDESNPSLNRKIVNYGALSVKGKCVDSNEDWPYYLTTPDRPTNVPSQETRWAARLYGAFIIPPINRSAIYCMELHGNINWKTVYYEFQQSFVCSSLAGNEYISIQAADLFNSDVDFFLVSPQELDVLGDGLGWYFTGKVPEVKDYEKIDTYLRGPSGALTLFQDGDLDGTIIRTGLYTAPITGGTNYFWSGDLTTKTVGYLTGGSPPGNWGPPSAADFAGTFGNLSGLVNSAYSFETIVGPSTTTERYERLESKTVVGSGGLKQFIYVGTGIVSIANNFEERGAYVVNGAIPEPTSPGVTYTAPYTNNYQAYKTQEVSPGSGDYPWPFNLFVGGAGPLVNNRVSARLLDGIEDGEFPFVKIKGHLIAHRLPNGPVDLQLDLNVNGGSIETVYNTYRHWFLGWEGNLWSAIDQLQIVTPYSFMCEVAMWGEKAAIYNNWENEEEELAPINGSGSPVPNTRFVIESDGIHPVLINEGDDRQYRLLTFIGYNGP